MVICVPGIFPQAGQSSVKVVPRHATSPAERRGEEWWGVGYRGRGLEDAQAGGRSASDGRLEELSDMSFVVGTVVPLSCSSRERAHPRTKTRRQDSCLDDQILKSPL